MGSSSSGSVSSYDVKKPAAWQGKSGGDEDDSTARTTWPDQIGGLTPSSQASAGAEEASTGSWAAVAASPATSLTIGPRERASPKKRVSARQAVSQSPDQRASNPRPKTSNALQQKRGEQERQSVEGTPKPRQREDVLDILRRMRPPPPSPFLEKEMVTTGRPETVGRGQRPHTLPSGRTNKDEENDVEYPGSYEYEDKDDEGMDDASMGADALLPDLQAIMTSIQALASTVAYLQIRHTGGQPQGRSAGRRPTPAIQAPEATPCRQPPPVDSTQQTQAAPDTLDTLGADGGEDSGLHAFPAIFTLLEEA